MGTGWSAVQSPPAIETMPCGSTTSTPEVFQSAAADSLAQATGLTLLEQNFEPARGAISGGYGEGVYEGLRHGVIVQKFSRWKAANQFARALAGGLCDAQPDYSCCG
jgi:hypothetical protein